MVVAPERSVGGDTLVFAVPSRQDGVVHGELHKDLLVAGRRCRWFHRFVEPAALHHPMEA